MKPTPVALRALQSPRLFEWTTTLFALSYGFVWCFVLITDRYALVVSGQVVEFFKPLFFVFSFLMTTAGAVGTAGLVLRAKWLRITASFILFAGFGWLALYFIFAVPLLPQAVYVYFAHAILEAIVFLRVKNDLSSYWDPNP